MARELVISADNDGRRVDRVLRTLWPGVPLGAIMKAIRTGEVRLDGKRTKGEARLAEGQRLTVPWEDGAKETPERFARMMEERLAYAGVSNEEIAREFDKVFPCDDGNMVVVKDIDVFSFCEHHIALMYDMKVSVAYIPNGRVLGLSKIARICDMAAKRLQLQERIGSDVAEIMTEASGSSDVAVIIHGTHSCMSARGIKKDAASTVTTTLRGRFETDTALQNQLYMMLAAR